MESVFIALAVHRGKLPPTINYENPDPECDLDYVANEAREARVEYGTHKRLRIRRHERGAGLQKV